MFGRSKKTRLHNVIPAKAGIPLFVALFLPAVALAAPHADPKMVELWSHMDEQNAWRGVQRAVAPRELRRAAPDKSLDALLDKFLDEHANTGLLVLKGDTILAERYQYERSAGHRLASASVAKTVLAMLVGIALHERKITSLDHTAGYYVPRLRGHPYADVTLRELLTMSSGVVSKDELDGRAEGLKLVANTIRQQTGGGLDAIREFEWRIAPSGTKFRYASADSQVLGLVLVAATGGPLSDYLSEKIWKPMGAEAHATWLVDKAGYEAAFCCLNAVLRDYARFGMLLANYGELDGKQIIPAEWVKAATTPQADYLKVGHATKFNGYGYQTWLLGDGSGRPREGGDPVLRFAALGLHGQAIFVDAASKLVVVHTAVWADGDDRAERGAQFRLFAAIHQKVASH
jgi:CubicO group peptidase (beta-lactamase class C family)